jgi:hypothetical protein
MPLNHILILQKVHLIVCHAEFFLESSDQNRPRIHFLPHPLLNKYLRLNQEDNSRGLFLFVDHTADDLCSEFVN